MGCYNFFPTINADCSCSDRCNGCSTLSGAGTINKPGLEGRITSLVIISVHSVYQNWFGQSGTTSIPTALSCKTFCKTLGIHINGGKE